MFLAWVTGHLKMPFAFTWTFTFLRVDRSEWQWDTVIHNLKQMWKKGFMSGLCFCFLNIVFGRFCVFFFCSFSLPHPLSVPFPVCVCVCGRGVVQLSSVQQDTSDHYNHLCYISLVIAPLQCHIIFCTDGNQWLTFYASIVLMLTAFSASSIFFWDSY